MGDAELHDQVVEPGQGGAFGVPLVQQGLESRLLRERVKDGLEALRLPVDERRFIPHISIAKFNSLFSVDRNLEVELEKIMALSFDPIVISSIKLFESMPEGGLHTHNTLAEIRLTP